MTKTVSVIIPAYNCEQLVGRALESILCQTHTNLEILVADDGSTDATRAALDAFTDERIVRLHHDQNIGYLKTVNLLLNHATGSYICFQDADDWSAPNRIELQVGALEDGAIDACGTGIYYTSANEKPLKRMVYPADREAVREHMLNGRPAACYASILFRRAILDTLGGYREFFAHGAEDVDWLLRVTEQHSYVNLEQPLYFYRFSPSSITHTTSILKLKSSLMIAREFADQRQRQGRDDLQAGNSEAAGERWLQICNQLSTKPGAEEIYKINMLLRRNAIMEAFRVCKRMFGSTTPFSTSLVVATSTLIKVLIGFERYESVKSIFARTPH